MATNKELIELNAVLNEVTNIKGKKFAYMVVKNKSLIEQELKVFEEIKRNPHPDYEKYELERKELCESHSKKDENGNIKSVDGKYDIEDMGAFQKDFEVLKEKYKEVIDDLQAAEQDFNNFLNDEAKVELVKVKIDDLPDDIDAEFLLKLKSVIE